MIIPGTAHKPYYSPNGDRVPSVTTILGVVDKNLANWANKLGLEGKSLSDESTNTMGIGTLLHGYIEGMFRNDDVDDSGFTEEQKEIAQKCFGKFSIWASGHQIVPLSLEHSLTSDRYGGTMDAILEIDGVVTIMDWKTSKSIYPEYFAQLSAYYNLLEDGIRGKVQQVGILKVPKENGCHAWNTISIRGIIWLVCCAGDYHFLSPPQLHGFISSSKKSPCQPHFEHFKYSSVGDKS